MVAIKGRREFQIVFALTRRCHFLRELFCTFYPLFKKADVAIYIIYIVHQRENHKNTIKQNILKELVKIEIYSSATIVDWPVSRNILERTTAIRHSIRCQVCRCVEKRLQIARRDKVRN